MTARSQRQENRRLQSKIAMIIDDHSLVVAEDLHDELVTMMHDTNGKIFTKNYVPSLMQCNSSCRYSVCFSPS